MCTQQTALEQKHISPMNDAVVIFVETNQYTFRDNGVPIDLVRCIVVVEKRRILLNIRVDVSDRQCSRHRFKIARLMETSIVRCRRRRISSRSSRND